MLSMEAAYGTGESASSCGKMCVETETAEGQFETLLGCPRFLKHLFSSPSIGSRNLTHQQKFTGTVAGTAGARPTRKPIRMIRWPAFLKHFKTLVLFA